MAIRVSQSISNGMLDVIEAYINSTTLGVPELVIYSGDIPPSLATTPAGGTLVIIILPVDWLEGADGGHIAKKGTWSAMAAATGEATFYRIKATSGGGVVYCIEGTVGATDSGADMTLSQDTTIITQNQTVTVSTFKLSLFNESS